MGSIQPCQQAEAADSESAEQMRDAVMGLFSRDRLSPSLLRVLAAVMDLGQRGPVTLRGICTALDWKTTNYCWQCLETLRERGLVSFENRKGGTIRPTCRYIPMRKDSANG